MPCELRDKLFLRYNDLVLEHAACSLRLADVAEIGNHTYFRIERRRARRIFDGAPAFVKPDRRDGPRPPSR